MAHQGKTQHELDAIEEWRAAREQYLARLDVQINRLEDAQAFLALSLSELMMRRARLDTLYCAAERAHFEVKRRCVLASNNLLDKAEERYLRIGAILEDRIEELRAERSESEPVVSTPTRNRLPQAPVQASFQPRSVLANSTMLPGGQQIIRIEPPRRPIVPKFRGNAAEWPAFRDLFESEVHNRTDIDAVMKLHHLREACVDAAATTMGPWPSTADSYLPAWEALREIYDDNYYIVTGIINRMHATPADTADSEQSLRALIDATFTGIRQLENTYAPRTILEQWYIHHVVRRLGPKAADDWNSHRNQRFPGALPTLADCRAFLESRSKGRRVNPLSGSTGPMAPANNHDRRGGKAHIGGNRDTRQQPYSKPTSAPSKERSQGYGQGAPGKCIMIGCNEVHYLGQCPLFARLSLRERTDIVSQHDLCRCCLMAGHRAHQCQRRNCSHCPPDAKSKHHFRLCQQNPFKREPDTSK